MSLDPPCEKDISEEDQALHAPARVGLRQRSKAMRRTVPQANLDDLLATVAVSGYPLIGPTIDEGVIAYRPISGASDLPEGWVEEQSGGSYRLMPAESEYAGALFAFTLGQDSWKRILHPPHQRLLRARRVGKEIDFTHEAPDTTKRALIGVRPCELKAIQILDKVLLDGPYRDTFYAARRANSLIVAVNCTRAGGTCFCASMETGPQAESGFDLVLTEILDDLGHRFLVEAGTDIGTALLSAFDAPKATSKDLLSAKSAIERARRQMGRRLATDGLKELLYRNVENAHWESIAARCLSCANCTMVCPTCFCSTIEDSTSLDGQGTERSRRQDSCFTGDFSYIHGGSVRSSPYSRYRQWMSHKLATWIDQFGTSGCVGCGRCITWCPVGIDITAEAQALLATDVGELGQRRWKGLEES